MSIRELFDGKGNKVGEEEYTPSEAVDTRIPMQMIAGLEDAMSNRQPKLPPMAKLELLQEDAPEEIGLVTNIASARQEMERINRRQNRIAKAMNQIINWMRNHGLQKNELSVK